MQISQAITNKNIEILFKRTSDFFVIVTKSSPKKTDLTPSTRNNALNDAITKFLNQIGLKKLTKSGFAYWTSKSSQFLG